MDALITGFLIGVGIGVVIIGMAVIGAVKKHHEKE